MITTDKIKTAAVEYSKPLTWGPSVAIDAFTAGAQWMQEQQAPQINKDEKDIIKSIYTPVLDAIMDHISKENSLNRFRLGVCLSNVAERAFMAGKQLNGQSNDQP